MLITSKNVFFSNFFKISFYKQPAFFKPSTFAEQRRGPLQLLKVNLVAD